MAENKSLLSLIVKALIPRLLFFSHGIICIWLLVKQENNNDYWYLTFFLGILVLEGIFNALVRHGKEFHWICPSAFLYCVVLIVTMVMLREGQLECIKLNVNVPLDKRSCSKDIINGTDHLANVVNSWETTHTKRISMIEQTGLLVLIIGRWLLPQGSISREQFSKIILIYVGTAADIVEFSEIYGEEDLGTKLKDDLSNVLHGLMTVWAISVLQFSLTIALPEDGLKEEDEDEEKEEMFEEQSYFRSRMHNQVAPMSYMHYKSLILNDTRSTAQINANTTSLRQVLPKLNNVDEENTDLADPAVNNNYKPIGVGINGRNFNRSPSTEELLPLPSIYNVNSRSSYKRNPNTRLKCNESESKNINKLSKKKDIEDTTKLSKFFNSKDKKRRPENPTTKEKHESIDISKKDVKTCFVKHISLIRILMPVVFQDGPFFIARFVLVAHYEVITEMIFLLIVKNGLVIVLNVYRILIMYCTEPEEKEPEIEDASVKVRTILNAKKTENSV